MTQQKKRLAKSIQRPTMERLERRHLLTSVVPLGFEFPDPLDGSSATSVSADGSVIAGYTFRYSNANEDEQAFRWQEGHLTFVGQPDLAVLTESTIPIGPDVSEGGSVIVGSRFITDFDTAAFRWIDANPDVMPVSENLFQGSAAAVSSDGTVIVGTDGGSLDRAVRWTEQGLVYLDGLERIGPGSPDSRALSVSADGSVIVGSIRQRGMEAEQAFFWTEIEGFTPLDDLGEGSVAMDVSADGSTIVGHSFTGVSTEAFLWTPDDGMVLLEDQPTWDSFSYATAVSGDGSTVVGYRGSWHSEGGVEAFRWSKETGIVGLGDLPGGEQSSRALDISADGTVIVGEATSENGLEAVRWTAPDLVPGISSPNVAQAGETIDLLQVIENIGSEQITVPFMVSFDLVSDTQAPIEFDVVEVNGVTIDANGNYGFFNPLTIPLDVEPGSYRLRTSIETATDVYELSKLNNVVESPFTVTEPISLSETVTVYEGSEAKNFIRAPGFTEVKVFDLNGGALIGSVDEPTTGGSVWTWKHTPPDGPKTRNLIVKATVAPGVDPVEATFVLQVQNQVPTIQFVDPPNNWDEGTPLTVFLHVEDPGTDDKVGISPDDGGIPPVLVPDASGQTLGQVKWEFNPVEGEFGWAWKFIPPDGPASHFIQVKQADKDGGEGVDQFVLNVKDVAPTFTAAIDLACFAYGVDPTDTFPLPFCVDEGSSAQVMGTYFDPGEDDHITFLGVWGTTYLADPDADADDPTEEHHPSRGTWQVDIPTTDGDAAESFQLTWQQSPPSSPQNSGVTEQDIFQVMAFNVPPNIKPDQNQLPPTTVLVEDETGDIFMELEGDQPFLKLNESDAPVSISGTLIDPGFDEISIRAEITTIPALSFPIGEVSAPPTGTAGQPIPWSWTFDTEDDLQGFVTISIKDEEDVGNSISFELVVNNELPDIEFGSTKIEVVAGQTARNSGTFSDPAGLDKDPVELNVVSGATSFFNDFIDDGNGTWAWTLHTVDPSQSGDIKLRANDFDGGVRIETFELVVLPRLTELDAAGVDVDILPDTFVDDLADAREDGILDFVAPGESGGNFDLPPGGSLVVGAGAATDNVRANGGTVILGVGATVQGNIRNAGRLYVAGGSIEGNVRDVGRMIVAEGTTVEIDGNLDGTSLEVESNASVTIKGNVDLSALVLRPGAYVFVEGNVRIHDLLSLDASSELFLLGNLHIEGAEEARDETATLFVGGNIRLGRQAAAAAVGASAFFESADNSLPEVEASTSGLDLKVAAEQQPSAVIDLVFETGDANLDSRVDDEDFEILLANFGKLDAGWTEGDFNGDGVVDFADFLSLSKHIG